MSQIKQPVPFLHINQIKNLGVENFLQSGSHSWLLGNRLESEEHINHYLATFFESRKIKFQCACIVDNLEKLKRRLDDFIKGNYQPYIDDHLKYADDETPEWEPYEELKRFLSTDGCDDLPPNIEQFAELLYFAKTIGLRKKLISEGFRKFFGDKVQMHYEGINEQGETVMVPESEVPAEILTDILLNRDIKAEFEAIEYEFCLDDYNDWLVAVTDMVNNHYPFAEIVQLFK